MFGEDIGAGIAQLTSGLLKRFGPDRVVDTPLSEQAFTSMATGAALCGLRPVIEFQIPSLLFLAFEQIANQAHKMSLMTGGQVSGAGDLRGAGLRVPGGLGGAALRPPVQPLRARRGEDGRARHAPRTPTGCWSRRSGTTTRWCCSPRPARWRCATTLTRGCWQPVPLGTAAVHRAGSDVTVVALGHLVHDALAVAAELAGEISVEVFDPRTVYPFDWAALAVSVGKTGRLVVIDDSNRSCGLGAEVIATAAEEMPLSVAARGG